MNDPDVFAILTPCDGYKGRNAETAFRLPHNAARYLEATGPITAKPAMASRETTPAPLSPSLWKHEASYSLMLKFSNFTHGETDGVLFGRNAAYCDVLIQCSGVSGRHFAVTVKEDGSWFLEDFISSLAPPLATMVKVPVRSGHASGGLSLARRGLPSYGTSLSSMQAMLHLRLTFPIKKPALPSTWRT